MKNRGQPTEQWRTPGVIHRQVCLETVDSANHRPAFSPAGEPGNLNGHDVPLGWRSLRFEGQLGTSGGHSELIEVALQPAQARPGRTGGSHWFTPRWWRRRSAAA